MGFKPSFRNGGKSRAELAAMFSGGPQPYFTGMSLEEALSIVLEVARNQEYDDVGDFDFEWTADHSEACGVVDRLYTLLSDEGTGDVDNG